MRNALAEPFEKRKEIEGHQKHSLIAFAIVCALSVATIFAAETFNGLEYITGHAGVKQQHGSLIVVGDVLRFTNEGAIYAKEKKTIFEIPLTTIVSAVASTEATHGVSAFSWNAVKSQDYVTIKTETAEGAEALVFKVGNKQAAGVAAKIEFAAKKAKG